MVNHGSAGRSNLFGQSFERLSRLRDLQLAIFPHSDVHRVESLVSDSFEPLKRMYHHLSYGVGFQRVDTIAQRQLNAALSAWLDRKAPQHDFNPERVTNGRLDEWPDSVIITTNLDYPQSQIDAIRTFRDEVHGKISAFYKEDLRTSKKKSFSYWLQRERRISGETILQAIELYARRIAEIAAGLVPASLDNLYSSAALNHYRLIEDVMRGSGVPDEKFEEKLTAFLVSVGLIRFRGHFSREGYDVHDGRHETKTHASQL